MTPLNISVTVPVGTAIDRVKAMLFKPFDLGKWFVIGFCAWLATLGQQGFGGGTGFHGQSWNGTDMRHSLDQAKDYVSNNLHWLLPVIGFAVLLGVVIWVLVIWLSSRGEFMFLHCVALDKAEVGVPWSKYAREANSLFAFRLLLGLGTLAVVLPLVAAAVLMGIRMFAQQRPSAGGILGLVGLGLAAMVVSMVTVVIAKFTRDFVVPIMFLRGGKCLAAWKTLNSLLGQNLGHFVVYLLFQILLSAAIGMLVFAIVIVTCCLAGCLMAVPYVGTVLLLPVLVFKRVYSIQYLAQYGSEYDAAAAAVAANAELRT